MTQQPKEKRFTPEELTRLLKDYWLVTDHSTMIDTINAFVEAYKNDLPIAPDYQGNPPISIQSIIDRLGLVLSDNGRKVLIPSTAERIVDFELLIPYFLQHCVNSHPKSYSSQGPQIEGLFFIYLRECLGCPLDEHLFLMLQRLRSQIKADEDEQVFPSGELPPLIEKAFLNPSNGLIVSVGSERLYDRILKLSRLARLYIGISNEPNLAVSEGAQSHWFNTMADPSQWKHQPAYRLIRSTTVPFENVAMFCRDLVHLTRTREPELENYQSQDRTQDQSEQKYQEAQAKYDRIVHCLTMRLEGMTEAQIKKALMLHKATTYEHWLRENFISMKSVESDPSPKAIYDNWTAAHNRLFPKGVAQPHIVFSGDYRDALVDGKSFSLNNTQSYSVAYLHEIDQGRSGKNWDEIKGYVCKERKLSDQSFSTFRKMFAPNNLEAFDALIERVRYKVYSLRYPAVLDNPD